MSINTYDPIAEQFYNTGWNLLERGFIDESLWYFRACTKLDPGIISGHLGIAHILLSRGEWAEGWREHEWRLLREDAVTRRPSGVKSWDGQPISEGALLIHTLTDGFGDVLMMMRFLPEARRRVNKIIIGTERSSIRLMAAQPNVDLVFRVDGDEPPISLISAESAMVSLPGKMGVQRKHVNGKPYIKINNRIKHAWSYWLKDVPGFKVGVWWQGSRKYPLDSTRSFKAIDLLPLSKIPNITLVSLQHGPDAVQGADLPFPIFDPGPSYRGDTTDWLDATGLVSNLDLVITCDTAIGHLCGALGIPAWIALSTNPYWCWNGYMTRSYWYNSVRLFRQTEAGNWSTVFNTMAAKLKDMITNKSLAS